MNKMKNKPLRHKEYNTFKFQPFSERINNVRVDIYHNVKHKYEEDTEETTFFHQTLEKWIMLNCSESFIEMREEIGYGVMILPQVLAQKDRLIEILKKHLSTKNPLNIQAVLELVVALAKDIRQEFHPYFQSVYELLVGLLSTKNIDQLEWTFQCLAYLFKFLWRYLVTNLSTVFESLLPLLSSNKPYYVNNFAAQSFAFVARKLKDPLKLIKLILRSLKKSPDGLDGCGRLLFEVIKGIPGQFHSCAEETLNVCFSSLEDDSLPYTPLCQLINSSVTHSLQNINVKHSSLLWNILKDKLLHFHQKWKETKNEKYAQNVKLVLDMLHQMISYKRSIYMIDHEPFVDIFIHLLKTSNQINPEISEQIYTSLSVILLSSIKISQELCSKIVVSVMDSLLEDDFMNFVSKILKFSGFDGLVLPRLIQFCLHKSPFKVLPLLTHTVLEKSHVPQNTGEFLCWTPYTIDFMHSKSVNPSILSDAYLNYLSTKTLPELLENLDTCVSILKILPHILPIKKYEATNYISIIIHSCCEILKEDSVEDKSKLLAILTTSLETLILLKPSENILKIFPPEKFLDAILPFANENNVEALRALDFYVCMDELNLILLFYDKIKSSIIDNLLSPYHKVREYTIHILYEIEQSLAEPNELMVSLLEISWKAEIIPPSLTEYRDKLKELQKLSCTNESVAAGMLKNELDYQVFLKLFIGNLYINFKLMWEPVSNLIVTYAETLKPNQFWSVYGKEIEKIAKVIKNNLCERVVTSPFSNENLSNLYMSLNNSDEKPDHIHHRILLWNVLQNCIPVCEAKNKDIATQFLLFMEEEYLKRNSEVAFTWNVKRQPDETMDETDITVLEESMDIEKNVEDMIVDDDQTQDLDLTGDRTQEDLDLTGDRTQEDLDLTGDKTQEDLDLTGDRTQEDDDDIPDTDKKFRMVTKSLIAHMEVLSKMRSPKNMHREPELSKIYYDFLSHKLPDVQKLALDCIMMYKHKFLTPYRENLYGIIDDKTFKNEVSLFKVDEQSEIIKPEHRADLIPILLRIMYSKMFQNGRKGMTKQQRKSTVIRFLAGCSSVELSSFFNMAFALLKDDINTKDDVSSMASQIIEKIDLEKVYPAKRLQSLIYLLNTLIMYCGGLLIPEQLSYLLRVHIALMANVVGVLKHREDVHQGHVKSLRNIRNVCFEGLNTFFSNFDDYSWTSEEIDAIFKVFIWPNLINLPSESINSPSSLLKLLFTWSKNPRYFPLFGKIDADSQLMPISSIMELWLAEKAHGSVVNLIMDLVESLLTLQDFETTENMNGQIVEPLKINDLVKLENKIPNIKWSRLNYGSKLLFQHIPAILERLDRKLQSKHGLVKRDLDVMSRVTELVTESESSDKLLTLLFPNLLKKSSAGEEVIIPLLTTVHNLIKNVENPGRYVLKLAPLFGTIIGPVARKLLFSIVITLSNEKGSECGLDGVLLEELNAYDRKWVDQPDFNKRLNAFKKIQEMVEEKKIPVNLGIIIIYTCFHFIKTEKDLSLRDNAKHCLENICPFLCFFVNDDAVLKNFVLNETIFNQIRSGITDKGASNIRDDCISLLGHMARECPDLHPVLKDLSHLSNKVDLEVDFFENIKHLQLHRRVRAMLKFANLAQTLEKAPTSRTITQFILPIVSYYFLSKKFATKNTIMDSAIAAIGTACKFLPWHQYQTVLFYYLGKLQTELDFQKQLVRVIVEILNAFHFDMSKADLTLLEFKKKIEIETKETMEESEKPEINTLDVKNLDETLDKTLDETIQLENDTLDEMEETKPTLIVDKLTILSQSSANKVVKAINVVILPQLHKILSQKNRSETLHKLSSKHKDLNMDDEIILKIPLTVAIVKLLQKLPSKELLDRNLIGVIMKLCTFLKSRLDSVRRVTRDTLRTIMISLGPSYLPMLVKEMSGILIKGFHLHVLAFSVHAVLVGLKPHFKRGDLDKCVHPILQICKMDLFSSTSEEKEVNQIVGKLLEARSTKSFDILHILATYVTDSYLLDLVIPLKEELSRTLSHKNLTKIENCFQNIILGLTENGFIESTSLLQLAFGTASESIPILTSGFNDPPVDPKKLKFESRRPNDIYIIPPEPKTKKALQSKVCIRTNAHFLVEFGFKLLLFLLKRSKVKGDSFIPQIDPFVQLLMDCFKSQHVKITTLAVKCMTWCLKVELPTLKQNIRTVTENLFDILHKFAAAGLTKGENFDLVMATFKCVATIVREVSYHEITGEHKRTLLLYCEQDLDDRNRQATAFSLIHAILYRKLQAPELTDVLKKVGNLSITTTVDSVRQQSLSVMLYYLKEYQDKIKIMDFLAFYFSQLSFSFETGRNSALDLISSIIKSFQKEFIREHCAVIYINVSTRLVNDPSPSCREKAANILELLISKVDNNSKEKLFDVTRLWFIDEKVAHKRLAAQLVGIFVKCEKDEFHKRLDEFLPLVTNQFLQGFDENKPGKCVLVKNNEKPHISEHERMQDHLLFQVLNMLVKMCNTCGKFLKESKYTKDLETIAEYTSSLLGYPHVWVRETAVQLLNIIVRTVPISEIVKIGNDPSLEKEGYLLSNTRAKIKSLILDLIAQLIPSENFNQAFLLQCMKLLVHIACIVKDFNPHENSKDQISLVWMVRRVRKSINFEIVQHPNSTVVRTMAFNWLAAVSVKLNKDELKSIASYVLSPMLREMNLDDHPTLKKIAKDAANCVKNKLGPDEYNSLAAILTTQLDAKRAEKKKERSQLMVTNPEVAAKRKINKQLKKKGAKKRKLSTMKNQTYKKKRMKEIYFEA